MTSVSTRVWRPVRSAGANAEVQRVKADPSSHHRCKHPHAEGSRNCVLARVQSNSRLLDEAADHHLSATPATHAPWAHRVSQNETCLEAPRLDVRACQTKFSSRDRWWNNKPNVRSAREYRAEENTAYVPSRLTCYIAQVETDKIQ